MWQLLCRCGAFFGTVPGARMLLRGTKSAAIGQRAEMPWFPDFASAVELVRQQTRAAGLADPVSQYVQALNKAVGGSVAV